MGEFDELDVLAAGLDDGVARQVRAALDRARAPIVVQVTGRGGVGRSSVAAALGLSPNTVTRAVDAVGRSDPTLDGDVVVYIVAGGPHPADDPPPERTLLVRNKIDLFDGPDGMPMVATLGLTTARHDITEIDRARFGALARSRDATLLLAEPLFRAADADLDAAERAALLDRWGFAGVACAVTALRRDPALDHAVLHRLLRSASGVDAVRRELANRVETARATRRRDLYAELDAVVARTGSEAVERFASRTAAHV